MALLETLLMVAPLLLDVIGNATGAAGQADATNAENKREDQYNANSGQHINNFINDYLLQPIGTPGMPGLNDASAFYAYDPNNPMAPMGGMSGAPMGGADGFGVADPRSLVGIDGGGPRVMASDGGMSDAFAQIASMIGGAGGPTLTAQGGQKPAGQQKTKPEDILGHAVNLLATSQPTEATFAAAQKGPQQADPMAGMGQLLGMATGPNLLSMLMSPGNTGNIPTDALMSMFGLGGAAQGDPNALMQGLFGGGGR